MPSSEASKVNEQELSGGTLTKVVRIDETVRRRIGPWTTTIQALLRHLERKGFEGCPRVLGIDEEQREILSFLPGEVANWPWPEVLRTDEGLTQYALLLRDYHRAVADFIPPANAIWRNPLATMPKSGETIRHGDTGPWNTVWNGSRVAGFIDWDFAAPGTARDDVLETIWHVTPLYSDDLCRQVGFETPPDRYRRIEVFLSAYDSPVGLKTSEQAAEAVLELASRERALTEELAKRGHEPWITLQKRRSELDQKFVWLEQTFGT